MRSLGAAAILVVLGLIPCSSLHAATWRVEKDGSGDFTVIQDALDAAAPGDSVLVGVGRFADFRAGVSQVSGAQFQAIAVLNEPGVVLRGAGRGLTTVGPDSLVEEFEGLPTRGIHVEGTSSRVEGFTVTNAANSTVLSVPMILQDCSIQNRGTQSSSFGTTVLDGVGAIIRHCEYDGPNGIATSGGGGRSLLVEDCSFYTDATDGFAVAIGNGARECVIRRCSINGGALGIQFSLSSTGYVEDCELRDLRVVGIDMSSGAAIVRRTEIGETRMSIRIGSGRLEVYDTEIAGGTQVTILSTGQLIVRNSHILNGGALTVDCRTSAPGEFLDLAENWWGTTDVAQIESWISDPNDRVTYLPILTEPVPTESQSVGSLKARFRGR